MRRRQRRTSPPVSPLGRLTHLHVRATTWHEHGAVRVQLYDAPPSVGGPCREVARPISVPPAYAADLLALLREGAAAVGIPVTVDGSYYAQGFRG